MVSICFTIKNDDIYDKESILIIALLTPMSHYQWLLKKESFKQCNFDTWHMLLSHDCTKILTHFDTSMMQCTQWNPNSM